MPEILAPCGSPETLSAALRAGADAVYLGGKSFSARQNARNFSHEELEQAVKACHSRGVKVYRTINTLIFDDQLSDLRREVELCAQIGIDGLITQDLALVEMVKAFCPGLPVHASTQMTVHTRDGVEMTKELGFSRAVLARELPLETIRELCKLGTEIEVFVHGAMCMSVSGQCYMSAVIGGRSANRGLCAQACRLPCSAVKGEDRCGLSLKDMSLLEHLRDLEEAGVTSLKIEGRMKRPEYVAMAVDSCKKALAGEPYDLPTLRDVFSRGGFTDGYLTGSLGPAMFGMRTGEDAEASRQALPKIHELYRRDEKRSRVDMAFTAALGEPMSLTLTDEQGTSVTVTGPAPEAARARSATPEAVGESLRKLGDSIYSPGELTFRIQEGTFIRAAALNALRRSAVDALDRARCEKNTPIPDILPGELTLEDLPPSPRTFRAVVTDLSQLEAVLNAGVELAAVPLDLAVKAAEAFGPDRLMVYMPRFTFDEPAQEERLGRAAAAGIRHLYATNLAHIRAARRHGLTLHLGPGLALGNSLALDQARKLGAADAVVSVELRAQQIQRLKKPMEVGVFGYGRLPLMLTVNCPIRCQVGCRECKKRLYDRTGQSMPVKCSRELGYVELLNRELTSISGSLGDFSAASFIMLYFGEESPEECGEVLRRFMGDEALEARANRGLYYRGVM